MVPEMGWAGKQNGDLLSLAEPDFDVFLTVDRNLSYQQAVAKFKIAVIVLVAKGNKRSDLVPLIPSLMMMLSDVQPGKVVKIGG